jgi:hypothetical protein
MKSRDVPSKDSKSGRFQPRPAARPLPMVSAGPPAPEPAPNPIAKMIATVGASVAAVFLRESESLAAIDAKISTKREELASGEHEMGRAALAADEGDEAIALAFARAEGRVRRFRDELRALELKRDAMVERQAQRVEEATRKAERERDADARQRVANMHTIALSVDEDLASIAFKTQRFNENAAALVGLKPHMSDQIATARAAFELCLTSRLRHMPNIKPKPFIDRGDRWANYCATPETLEAIEANRRERQLAQAQHEEVES